MGKLRSKSFGFGIGATLVALGTLLIGVFALPKGHRTVRLLPVREWSWGTDRNALVPVRLPVRPPGQPVRVILTPAGMGRVPRGRYSLPVPLTFDRRGAMWIPGQSAMWIPGQSTKVGFLAVESHPGIEARLHAGHSGP